LATAADEPTVTIAKLEDSKDPVAAVGVEQFALRLPQWPQPVRGGLASASGAILMRICQQTSGMAVVPAASLVGLLGGVVLPNAAWRLPFFCGTFVGMSSQAVLGSPGFVGAAGLVTGALVLHRFDGSGGRHSPIFLGHGGRLGFMATLVTVAAWSIRALKLLCFGEALPSGSIRLLGLPRAQPPYGWVSSLLGPLIGALATRAWMDLLSRLRGLSIITERLGNSVSASSLVAALACITLSGSTWPALIFMGSFVAMSGGAVLSTYWGVAGASFVTALLHYGLAGCLTGGFGGRLGFSALLGVLTYRTFRQPAHEAGT